MHSFKAKQARARIRRRRPGGAEATDAGQRGMRAQAASVAGRGEARCRREGLRLRDDGLGSSASAWKAPPQWPARGAIGGDSRNGATASGGCQQGCCGEARSGCPSGRDASRPSPRIAIPALSSWPNGRIIRYLHWAHGPNGRKMERDGVLGIRLLLILM